MESRVLEIKIKWGGGCDVDLGMSRSKINLKSGEILWINPVPRVCNQAEFADFYEEVSLKKFNFEEAIRRTSQRDWISLVQCPLSVPYHP
jgi:hypothetical protein